MTNEDIEVCADPHGLKASGEPVAIGAEISKGFSVKRMWLRGLRLGRKVRYIDLHPNLKPGRQAADRYLYAISDVEKCIRERRERAIQAAKDAASKK